ncbi:MAG: sugar phosphate isomerase/epimerase, partial [Prevotella sp.]|nr:sugar phosphate isomerase/epimerase [Prevotella sp.]
MEKIRLFIISLFAFCMFMPDAMIAQERYQVGVCDWMVLKRQKLGEFELAKQLGCDGIEMDMGSLGTREMFDNKIRDPKEAAIFKRTADSLGIKVGAVAMSGFYAQDLSKKDTYMALAEDCFNTMDKMGQTTVAFLPLGGSGNDWSTDKA